MHKCRHVNGRIQRALWSHRSSRRLFATLDIPTTEVTDADIVRLASKPLHPLTLRDLVKFALSDEHRQILNADVVSRHGSPPLTKEQLLDSANFTLSVLPTRLAHRIQSLRSLPYIVVASPIVSAIHGKYVHSLATLLPFAERRIQTLEEEIHFTEVMADLVQTHANTISVLARGFLEARRYISPTAVTDFLDEHLRARIGTRLLAEQHIALHVSSQPHSELMRNTEASSGEVDCASFSQSNHVGVIDMALRPANIVRSCESLVGDICELNYGIRPTITLDGELDTTIAHVPMHLEYILTELLKNSFRATIENRTERVSIVVTIAPTPRRRSTAKNALGSDPQTAGEMLVGIQGSQSQASLDTRHSPSPSGVIEPLIDGHQGTRGVTIRIRDRGGGISPDNVRKLWNYGFTTFPEDQILERISGGDDGGSKVRTDDALDTLSGVGGNKSSLAGLGYGLPLGRAYAEYFNGRIAVQSLWGWGTDVYLHLKGVGEAP